jgi:Rrf2 family transcriptional regulator, nitric oxide-sensitive transcriptional repressor
MLNSTCILTHVNAARQKMPNSSSYAMQLTLHTDYALRVLIYVNTRESQTATVKQIAAHFSISYHHLMKVVQHLTQLHYVQATRGRHGGLRLAQAPEAINLGQIIRQLEPNLDLAECFNHTRNTCPLTPRCVLKRALYEARQAFLQVLDGYHLAELTQPDTRGILPSLRDAAAERPPGA